MDPRYPHDPAEQDGDDAPFPGGSTEAKDAFLAERGHVRNTPAQTADWHRAYAAAQAIHDAPDAELLAWARPILERECPTTRDGLYLVLVCARASQIGRVLFTSERQAVNRVVMQLWATRQAVA